MDAPEKPRIRGTASALNPTVLRAVLALIGFTAMIAQIVLMRELMVIFYGNEISLGLMLANWLLWTAVGSSVLGRLEARAQKPRRHVAGLQILIFVTFPSTLWLVRASRGAFQPLPGEILGPGPMFLTSLGTLSLFCLTSGCLFAAGSRLYTNEVGVTTGAGTSSLYLLESVGSAAGGLVASFFLIRYLDAFAIASVLGLLNLLAASMLLAERVWQRHVSAIVLLGAFALLVFPILSPRFEILSLAKLWRGYHLVATRNSIYGNLAVVETEASRSLYENGLVVLTVPDPSAAEEAVHYALLQHPSPKTVLLIGGGINGSLAQVLQHPSLERVDYVELDPAIIDLARRYFSGEWKPVQADSRVRVHSMDGRLFAKTTHQSFDVIVLNLPDPQTAQLNRFYTAEFFREVAARLNPDGVFSFQLRGAEDYISPELAAFLQCINKSLRVVFPEVSATPGEAVHFFAATRAGILAAGPQELVSRLRSRGIRTSYVREYYIPFRMSPDRMRDLDQQIRPRADTRINQDFAPIAYYFNVALWSSRFDQRYRRLFEAASHASFIWTATLAGLILFGLAAALMKTRAGSQGSAGGSEHSGPQPAVPGLRSFARATAGFCTAAMGFTLIGLEILLLLAFQAVYGYVYHQLAVVIAAFMAGMALGSWWALRRTGSSKTVGHPAQQHPETMPSPPWGRGWSRRAGPGEGVFGADLRRLAALQTLAALSPLVLYLLLVLVAPTSSTPGLFVISQVVFPALAVLCGLLGGYQFPLASRIFFGDADEQNSSPGSLYALDLMGACLAAVALSAYVVPVFGFLKTALLMAVVNLAPAALAGFSPFEYRAAKLT